MPGKNIDAQLLFQFDDGFGYTWLRRVQGFGRLGQVQVATSSFLNKLELM